MTDWTAFLHQGAGMPAMQQPATIKDEQGGFKVSKPPAKVKAPPALKQPAPAVPFKPAKQPKAPAAQKKAAARIAKPKYPRMKPSDIAVDSPDEQENLSGFVNDALDGMERPTDPWRREMQHRGLEWNFAVDGPENLRGKSGYMPGGYWNPKTNEFQPEQRPYPYSLKQLTYPGHERDEYLHAHEKHRGQWSDLTKTPYAEGTPYMKELIQWGGGRKPYIFDSDDFVAQTYAQRRAENPQEPMSDYEKKFIAPKYKKRYKDEAINQIAENEPEDFAKLSGVDRRWVDLESARFVAANRDTLDDSHELAVRAHNHAAVKTSTFTQQRSAAVCKAFVRTVTALGQRQYRPTPRMASAPNTDFPDSLMFL